MDLFGKSRISELERTTTRLERELATARRENTTLSQDQARIAQELRNATTLERGT
ncbi:MAG: hypothetical protein AABX70_05295 [Nanoarchaeota archaeon]